MVLPRPPCPLSILVPCPISGNCPDSLSHSSFGLSGNCPDSICSLFSSLLVAHSQNSQKKSICFFYYFHVVICYSHLVIVYLY